MPSIQFYFDYESPNAYLAWTQLPQLADRHGFVVEPVPILYAALLDANGQLGPGEQPTKGRLGLRLWGALESPGMKNDNLP